MADYLHNLKPNDEVIEESDYNNEAKQIRNRDPSPSPPPKSPPTPRPETPKPSSADKKARKYTIYLFKKKYLHSNGDNNTKKIQFFSTDLSEAYESHSPPRTSIRIQVSVSRNEF